MRSPDPVVASSRAPTVIVVGTAVALIALAGLASLLLYRHAIPPEVLDGLTSPASFGARTS
jgi:hypothetical protein